MRLPWSDVEEADANERLEASLGTPGLSPVAMTLDRVGDRAELIILAGSAPSRPARSCTEWRETLAEGDRAHFDQLRTWRSETARAEQRPAYTVLTNRALTSLACLRPRSVQELLEVPGVGPRTAARFASPLLAIMRDHPDLHRGVLHDEPLPIDATEDDESVAARSGAVRVSEDPPCSDG